MAIPTVVAVGAVDSGTTANISPTLPTGWAPNDIHVMFLETSNEPITLLSGWSLAGSGFVAQSGGLITGLTVWWRRAVVGDNTPSVAHTGDHKVARIIGVRGCPTSGDPWDATSYTTENVADTSVATPAITATAGTDVLALFAVTTGQDTATAQLSPATWTNASLSGVVTQMNNWVIAGNGGGFAVGSGGKASGGAISSSTGTLVTANFKTLFSGALKAAAVVASPFPPRRRTHPNRLR